MVTLGALALPGSVQEGKEGKFDLALVREPGNVRRVTTWSGVV